MGTGWLEIKISTVGIVQSIPDFISTVSWRGVRPLLFYIFYLLYLPNLSVKMENGKLPFLATFSYFAPFPVGGKESRKY